MKKFETKFIIVSGAFRRTELAWKISDAGKEGWELVTVLDDHRNETTAWLKREIIQGSKSGR